MIWFTEIQPIEACQIVRLYLISMYRMSHIWLNTLENSLLIAA